MPLFSYISEDPYLDKKESMKQFLQQYLEVNKMIRIDLLQRMLLKRISEKLDGS